MDAPEATSRQVLRMLRKNPGAYVSGTMLADRLGLSRTGIWKHIRNLKSLGYGIVSHPREGYKLVEVPDTLIPEEVAHDLRTSWLAGNYHYLATVGSTNDVALQLALEGAPHGTVVSAEEQTRGRGRLRRDWLSSPRRGIYMTILLRTPLPVREASQSVYIAALALAKTLRSTFRLPSSIKWPNDVLVRHKKVAGILTEMQSDQEQTRFLVIGIGINVNHTQEELAGPFRYPATSVAIELGRPIRRQELMKSFLERFEMEYDRFLDEGFGAILPELEEFSDILGKNVSVLCGKEEIEGRALGFTPEGALVLLTREGRKQSIWAGDVTRVEGSLQDD